MAYFLLSVAVYHSLLMLCLSATSVTSSSIVKYLPGFHGELPFTLETGYVAVGSSELFYYFIESEGNPKEDPLLLWYSGGPGCSALNGPLEFNISDYEGGLPLLAHYPYSWTRTASILFVDAPVGTGFSYSTTEAGWPMSDTLTGEQVYFFLMKWMTDHPQFLKLQLFVGADSYSGISCSLLVKHILDGNSNKMALHLNLKGYILGCPRIDEQIQENSMIVFAHRMTFVSDELFKAANEACNSNFYGASLSDGECYENLQLIKKCTKDINKNDILEPKCTFASPRPNEEGTARRSMQGDSIDFPTLPSVTSPEKWCHNFNYSLSYDWANDEAVQAALNVRLGTVPDWTRCNKSLDYTKDVKSVIAYHRNFSTMRLQALIYNGDHDFTVANVGTQKWITMLNLTTVNDWRPWFVDGQVAGYTIKYSQNAYHLTYATIKGAGHPPQEYKRRECYAMFDRFIHYYPI